jgi:hypothetical protein
MIRFLLAAFLAVFSFPAAAQGCMALDAFRAMLKAQKIPHDLLTVARTRAAAQYVDEATGAEDSGWDVAIVGLVPDGSLFIAVGKDGSICAKLDIPEEGYKVILRRIYGWKV